MATTIAVERDDRELNALLDRLAEIEGEVVLERDGRAAAVVFPADSAAYKRYWGERLRTIVRRIGEANRDVPQEVLEAEIAEAIREVRAERTQQAPG